MEDILDVAASPTELREFQWKYQRQIWDPVGMICPIPDCPETNHFSRLGRYLEHYEKFHRPNVTLLSCIQCGRKERTKCRARRHIRTCHPSFTQDQFVPIEVANINYINPGDFLPPRSGSVEERKSRMLQAREEAAGKRRREAVDVTTSLARPGPSQVCRDEEVFSRPGGSMLKRRKTKAGDRSEAFHPEEDPLEYFPVNH